MKIKCIIIDDEPTSQNVLKKFISDIDFLELVSVCDNAIEALQVLKNNTTITLLFLDINMPKISGLTFYKSLQNSPNVIFTTAYPQYAVDGFELNAIDYLLKPFSFERFFTAVNKVLHKQTTVNTRFKAQESIIIKSNKVLHKITPSSIIYLEAFGDYVKVHLENKFILTNSTFSNLLKSLEKYKFVRTHKSFAINLEKLNTVNGNQITINEQTIPIGQKYKSEFLKLLNSN
ncbi:response regulator [Flavobacteriaceae bacterium AU392]|nr:DNA-binding response regulator [Flavobacteriaceae bacterium]RKM86039.1 response regulator [Flavobacteriaceae bacterium AU392]